MGVRLTDDQRLMLEGGRGGIVQKLMRLLVRLGEIYGAGRMVDISSAQISGVSYKSIGDPGLEFLEDVAGRGARVSVPAFMNPAGMDLEDWRALGFPEEFAAGQKRIIDALTSMGVAPSATCTPYLAGNLPRRGEHLAWAESSAVSYANSVIGARTNREGGPSALAAAVCGCTPLHGLHIDDNRGPSVRVEVDASLASRADHGALGWHVGRKVESSIPYFTGLGPASPDDLKALGAAMAASGAVALYHAGGLTPEAHLHDPSLLPSIRVGRKELDEACARLGSNSRPDLVVTGCPHASLEEVADVAHRLEGRKLATPLWVCTSRFVKDLAAREGLQSIIEQAGGRLVADTCMVVAPIERMGFKTTAVDSGKAAHYLPGLCGQRVVFRDLASLIEEAIE
ncbi:MAG: aconitase X catalytic domain-containing protein [Deltaproteobacteria bacterium]|nr:aconitase X catalytic domain-containing protein [Deltaproteobacteria bacterium]